MVFSQVNEMQNNAMSSISHTGIKEDAIGKNLAQPMTASSQIQRLEQIVAELQKCQCDADIQELSMKVQSVMSELSGVSNDRKEILRAMQQTEAALHNAGQSVKRNRMKKMRTLLTDLPKQSPKKQRKMLRKILSLLAKHAGVEVNTGKRGICGWSMCSSVACISGSVLVLAGATAVIAMAASGEFEVPDEAAGQDEAPVVTEEVSVINDEAIDSGDNNPTQKVSLNDAQEKTRDLLKKLVKGEIKPSVKQDMKEMIKMAEGLDGQTKTLKETLNGIIKLGLKDALKVDLIADGSSGNTRAHLDGIARTLQVHVKWILENPDTQDLTDDDLDDIQKIMDLIIQDNAPTSSTEIIHDANDYKVNLLSDSQLDEVINLFEADDAVKVNTAKMYQRVTDLQEWDTFDTVVKLVPVKEEDEQTVLKPVYGQNRFEYKMGSERMAKFIEDDINTAGYEENVWFDINKEVSTGGDNKEVTMVIETHYTKEDLEEIIQNTLEEYFPDSLQKKRMAWETFAEIKDHLLSEDGIGSLTREEIKDVSNEIQRRALLIDDILDEMPERLERKPILAAIDVVENKYIDISEEERLGMIRKRLQQYDDVMENNTFEQSSGVHDDPLVTMQIIELIDADEEELSEESMNEIINLISRWEEIVYKNAEYDVNGLQRLRGADNHDEVVKNVENMIQALDDCLHGNREEELTTEKIERFEITYRNWNNWGKGTKGLTNLEHTGKYYDHNAIFSALDNFSGDQEAGKRFLQYIHWLEDESDTYLLDGLKENSDDPAGEQLFFKALDLIDGWRYEDVEEGPMSEELQRKVEMLMTNYLKIDENMVDIIDDPEKAKDVLYILEKLYNGSESLELHITSEEMEMLLSENTDENIVEKARILNEGPLYGHDESNIQRVMEIDSIREIDDFRSFYNKTKTHLSVRSDTVYFEGDLFDNHGHSDYNNKEYNTMFQQALDTNPHKSYGPDSFDSLRMRIGRFMVFRTIGRFGLADETLTDDEAAVIWKSLSEMRTGDYKYGAGWINSRELTIIDGDWLYSRDWDPVSVDQWVGDITDGRMDKYFDYDYLKEQLLNKH